MGYKGFSQEVGIGVESEYGTAVAPTVRVLNTGPGLSQKDENTVETIKANSSYPAPKSHTVTKQSNSLSLSQLLYPSNAADLIGYGNTRDATTKELQSLTIVKNEGISAVGSQYAGCKVGSMSLKWTSEGLVELSLELTAKKRTKAVWTAAGDFPSGHPFRGCLVAVTVNSVTASKVESGEISWNNNLTPGPTGSDFAIQSLNEGFCDVTGNIKAEFVTDAWNALARDISAGALPTFTVVVTLTDPVIGGDSLTITMTGCVSTSTPLEVEDQGGVVKQTINFTSGDVPTLS